ncbi:hypothetical protein ABW19_dt0202603 [Dactylella cylindrospora]|nr:hypothetical protein ABW19_dt0202603 [Dactylella cylindrospora]
MCNFYTIKCPESPQDAASGSVALIKSEENDGRIVEPFSPPSSSSQSGGWNRTRNFVRRKIDCKKVNCKYSSTNPNNPYSPLYRGGLRGSPSTSAGVGPGASTSFARIDIKAGTENLDTLQVESGSDSKAGEQDLGEDKGTTGKLTKDELNRVKLESQSMM